MTRRSSGAILCPVVAGQLVVWLSVRPTGAGWHRFVEAVSVPVGWPLVALPALLWVIATICTGSPLVPHLSMVVLAGVALAVGVSTTSLGLLLNESLVNGCFVALAGTWAGIGHLVARYLRRERSGAAIAAYAAVHIGCGQLGSVVDLGPYFIATVVAIALCVERATRNASRMLGSHVAVGFVCLALGSLWSHPGSESSAQDVHTIVALTSFIGYSTLVLVLESHRPRGMGTEPPDVDGPGETDGPNGRRRETDRR